MAVTTHSLLAQGTAMPVAEQFKSLHFRSIGPATMSGRIADLAVYEANPAIYYVATAHGGVWKTTSNGTTFIPQFQDQGLISIGDVTISQTNPDLVWVGAGESNNRQSTSWGGGVYKSTNGGTTFQHMGLAESKHINRIVIDPTNNDVVLVAATGPLFGSGGERGIYKTTDGGRTWRQVLRVDDWTGANDLVVSATNPRIMFASTYQRVRNACCMNGGGPGSGIWRSTDGGDTWTRLTGNGLPDGPLGRIALDVFRRSGNFVYALIEGPSQGRGGGGGGGGPAGAAPAAASTPKTGLWRSEDGGNTWRFVNAGNPRPMYFSQVRIDPNSPDRVYLGGVGMWMTIDGGRSFEQDAAFATHDDVHAIWINPANSDHILIGNDGGLAVSYDMSKTWQFLPNLPVGLFYHVGYDMEVPYNVCGGMQDNYNWCGPSASRHNRGIFNYDWFNIQGGDGFVAIPDLRDSRIIYTESQGGNMIRRDKVTGESKSIRPSPQNVTNYTPGDNYRFFWDSPMIYSTETGALLVAANKLFKSTDRGDSWTVISPDLTQRVNRDTIVTMGVKGSDINIATNDGIGTYGTLVTIAESPAQVGVYYTGADDGTLSVSRNGGQTWANITANLPGAPKNGFISDVVPSKYAAGTAYVTIDNHLLNDYAPYIWVTTDYGASFTSLVGNLKGENVRTLTEDPRNPNILYIGTETGIFVSMNKGGGWMRLKGQNFPTVRVDEITIHPRDNAMLIATHGRAIWILDHLEPIQEYAAVQAASGDAKLFSIPVTLQWKSKDDRNDEFWGHQFFAGENPPTDAVIQFHLKQPVANLRVRISDGARTVRTLDVPTAKNVAGIQTVCWDQRVEPLPATTGGPVQAGRGGGGGGGRGASAVPNIPQPLPVSGYMPEDPCSTGGGGGGGGFGGFGGGGNAGPHVAPGSYTVALIAGDRTLDSKPMRIIMDPAARLNAADRARWTAVTTELHDAQRRGNEIQQSLNTLHSQMAAAVTNLASNAAVPANVKSQFESLNKDFEAVRVKFGVPFGPAAAPGRGGGGGGGGGGRGGGAPDQNVLARVAASKATIMSIWEPPSDAVSRQAASARSALTAAIAEANALLARARTVSTALKPHNVTLNVP